MKVILLLIRKWLIKRKFKKLLRRVLGMAEVPAKVLIMNREVTGNDAELQDIAFMISPDEEVLVAFRGIRDALVITNKKVLTLDVQGITGRKKDFRVIPLSKISAFSCETAGTFDLDSEFKIWASGIGLVEVQLVRGSGDIRKVAAILNQYVL